VEEERQKIPQPIQDVLAAKVTNMNVNASSAPVAVTLKRRLKPCINLIMPKRQVQGAESSTYRHRTTSKQMINKKYSLGFEAIDRRHERKKGEDAKKHGTPPEKERLR
jgi:hypothetical protein